MNVLISDLSPATRELAEKRRAENPVRGIDEDRLSFAFKWTETPEGESYWNSVYREAYTEQRRNRESYKDDEIIFKK